MCRYFCIGGHVYRSIFFMEYCTCHCHRGMCILTVNCYHPATSVVTVLADGHLRDVPTCEEHTTDPQTQQLIHFAEVRAFRG